MPRTTTTPRGCRPFSVHGRKNSYLGRCRAGSRRTDRVRAPGARQAPARNLPHEPESRDPRDWRRGLAVSGPHCPHQRQMELRRLRDPGRDARAAHRRRRARRHRDLPRVRGGAAEVRFRGSRQGRHARVRAPPHEYARPARRAVLGRRERAAGSRGPRPGRMGRRPEGRKPNPTTDIISGFSTGKAPMRRGERTITSSKTS